MNPRFGSFDLRRDPPLRPACREGLITAACPGEKQQVCPACREGLITAACPGEKQQV